MSEKYEVIVTKGGATDTFTADGMGWEYPQTDGEGSGATDENVMYREVLPERDKITLRFDNLTEQAVRRILAVRSYDVCSVNYYDLRAGSRVTKTMYPVSDEVKARALINGGFIVEPFELRFIQTIPD